MRGGRLRRSRPMTILAFDHPTMATMNAHEQLYEKLNNVHASLRKEKEDAYRSKQLAEQRLQLARSDREAAERKGSETVTQLRQLKEKAIEMKKVNAIVEAENRLMEKEVRMFAWTMTLPSSPSAQPPPPPLFSSFHRHPFYIILKL